MTTRNAISIAYEGTISNDGQILSFNDFKEAIDACPNLVIMDDQLWLLKDVKGKSISEIIYDIRSAQGKT